jgi:hypothetical protein
MSSNRSKLTMDEQSFQDMLAAAYTIQEHNAKRKRAPQPEPTCGKCGAAVNEGESLCPLCAAEEVRPGEKLQQKWATMWLMGQEQGLFPEPTPNEFVPPSHESSKLASGADEEAGIAAEDSPDRIGAPEEETPYQESLQLQPDEPRGALSDSIELSPDEVESAGDQPPEPEAPHWPLGLRDLQLKLRFHRADLYLVAAIIVSTFAMLWVLLATPAPGVQNKPRLRPWERAMISLGLAEAPDPPAQRGNPNAQVWVDPKTALYYCYGDDQYGKTPGGHQATQREAQLDSFQPASRAACE